MTEYYKSYRIIDGKPRWVIVDNTGNIINRNPSKEELKGLEKEKYKSQKTNSLNYNKTNTCDRCRDKDIKTELHPGNARRELNKEGDWTGRWLCPKCKADYYNNLPDSSNNIKKSLRYHRTENLDKNSGHAKGDDFEELTHRWKGVKILGKENDCYNGPLDHSIDSEGKRPQTKGRWYDSRNRYWHFGSIEREWEKEFDYEICYCASRDGKIIERIYIIPKKEIKDKRKSISIYKNPSRCEPWYEQYRITDEETIKKVNDIWKKIIETRT